MKTKLLSRGLLWSVNLFWCISAMSNQVYGPSMNQHTGIFQGRDDSYANDIADANAKWAALAAAERQKAKQKEEDAYMPPDAWREFKGQTNYIRVSGVEFCGKVLQVLPDGVRVSGDFGQIFHTSYHSQIEDSDRNQEFMVVNFPYSAVEDQVIPSYAHYMAYYAGTYTYTTVQGASRTIRKLNYGRPCDVPQWFLDKQKELAKATQAAEVVKRQKLFLAESNAIVWLQLQATNGDTSAQCSLGEHYLNGVGCDTNRELGITWITRAANAGNLEASNKLVRLQIKS